jgi:hypothetical protein
MPLLAPVTRIRFIGDIGDVLSATTVVLRATMARNRQRLMMLRLYFVSGDRSLVGGDEGLARAFPC